MSQPVDTFRTGVAKYSKLLIRLSLFRFLRFSGFVAAFIYSGCPGTNPDIYRGICAGECGTGQVSFRNVTSSDFSYQSPLFLCPSWS